VNDGGVGSSAPVFPHQSTESSERILSEDEVEKLKKDQALVSDFKQQKLEVDAQKNWDLFYKRNTTNFFKDRHWTTREFEELKACREFESQRLVMLEAGCGVGNCIFPLLEEDLNIFIYACDFSPRAVQFVKENSLYCPERCLAFQCDLTKDDLHATIAENSLDVATLIFVLSAIHPERMHQVLENIYRGELEKLNQSTDDINRCETELEDARQRFRSVLVEATLKLDELLKKIGKAIEDSKPYWEARRVARQAQLEAQRTTQDFQRAAEVLRAAKETIALAEQRLLEEDKRHFDSAWQEMLNHATQRVMEAEQTKSRSELLHKETAARYNAAMSHMKQLEKKLKRTISKSKPYFEMKAKYYLELEQLKTNVDDLQTKLTLSKGEYKTALKNLEMISDEIHERRRSLAIGFRERGVGSEGDGVNGDDLTNFKMESDGISMTSEMFEDENCSNNMSEEDSETQSTCSMNSGGNSPLPLQCPFSSSLSPSFTSSSSSSPSPLSRPCSLELPSTVSLSDFALISPILGPRSECSGASSPDCDMER
ncbi:SH3 domain-binding protein 5, partial [Clarias magur]